MKKAIYFWFSGIFVLLIYFLVSNLWVAPMAYQDLSLGEFIIGRWHLRESAPPSNYFVTEVEFINAETMLVDIETPEGPIYNLMFHYEFIGENRIRIRGRLGDEWQLTKKDDELIVDSSRWPGNYKNTYQRTQNINWSLIAFVLALFAFGTAFINFRLVSDGDVQNTNSIITNKKLSGLFNKIIWIAIFISIWVLGVVSGSIFWSFPSLLRVRLPWDSALSFELGIIMLILGIKIIRVNRFVINESGFLLKGIQFLGTFMVGNAFWGIVTAIMKLALFILYGSYFS